MAEEVKTVVALAADMIFGARMRGAVPDIVLARNPDDLLAKVRELGPRLVVLDLDRRGLAVGPTVEQLKAAGVPVLCYVSHVREDLIAEARAAGADRVLARGAFANRIAELLAP